MSSASLGLGYADAGNDNVRNGIGMAKMELEVMRSGLGCFESCIT
jgi:hypothetical protein